jgi:diaminopimelate epimerase
VVNAKELCKKYNTDGLLVVTLGENYKVKVDIFNSDGSDGGLCLNGARCAARFLYEKKNFPKEFVISMGEKNILTKVNPKTFCITQEIELGKVLGEKTIKTGQGEFSGYCVDVGNPHFIIFEKKELSWLKKYGFEIESHSSFKNRTNVEFVWPSQEKNCYKVIVYERGCGVTAACSSGVVAIATLLHNKKKFPHQGREKFVFSMPGGDIICFVIKGKKVALVLF